MKLMRYFQHKKIGSRSATTSRDDHIIQRIAVHHPRNCCKKMKAPLLEVGKRVDRIYDLNPPAA